MASHDLSIYCPHCHKFTALQTAKAKVRSEYGSISYTLAIWEKNDKQKWWIGICNSCNEPVLVRNTCEIVFPHPLPKPTDTRIPELIRNDLIEAKLCFSISAYRGCAVLARRSIQTTCIDKGAKKNELVHQLDELMKSGVITSDLKEWATIVRWVGNDAAHPNKDIVTKEDAEDILNLAEQFLHVIYIAPSIAKEQREKRGK